MNHGSVCITGYGVLSPLGQGLEAFDDALFGGDSAVCVEELVLPGMAPCKVPLARCDFDESQVQAPSKVALDRGSAMALAAAATATRQAAWAVGDTDPERVGIYWGSGMGGGASFDDNCHTVYAEQRRLRPTSVVTTMPNAALAELALRYAARGAAIGYACACASAAVAIGEALHALRAGRLDLAIVGGSEAPLAISIMGAWHAMRVLAPVGDAGNEPGRVVCRPFAADRAGFALGEGAAALVLESEAHARARRVGWDVQLSGYASTCDGLYITQPDPAGQVRAMQAALRDAGLTPGEIGHVNAHGTATSAGDAAEAESLGRVFGGKPPAVTATKAAMGHLLGAGGAVELVATLRALQRRMAPPTAHQAALDAGMEIDLVRGQARELPRLKHAMSNSFAFGGTNAVLVASRVE